MKVRILSGIPGSGKTTYGKGLGVVVSADHLFETLGEFIPHRIGEAHQSCYRHYLALLANGKKDIVVDNTNLHVWEISPYMLAGQAYGAEVEIVRIKCDPEVAFARQTHNVPREVFDGMVEQFNRVDVLPWWTVKEVRMQIVKEADEVVKDQSLLSEMRNLYDDKVKG